MATLRVLIGTWRKTFFEGAQCLGEDEFGNKYYQESESKKNPRRWVVYKGRDEASKVPPQWHGWLHYTHEVPLVGKEETRYLWQKGHVPNLTGTEYAYRPDGHIMSGGQRASTTSDYQAWSPKE